MEICDPAVAGVVFAAMTYRGLADWFNEEHIVFPGNETASAVNAG